VPEVSTHNLMALGLLHLGPRFLSCQMGRCLELSREHLRHLDARPETAGLMVLSDGTLIGRRTRLVHDSGSRRVAGRFPALRPVEPSVTRHRPAERVDSVYGADLRRKPLRESE
jgi:hypothetical protein